MLRKSFLSMFATGVTVFAGTASAQRFTADQKGSVLVFSRVQITWDAQGNLLQDTLLGITNDADAGGVEVQAYFINGDPTLEEETDPNTGAILQAFEPGWNTADCRFHLTHNNPIYWSAARGGGNVAFGGNNCQPFDVLDADGPGRPNPADGGQTRILRGMVIMWAVGFDNTVEKPDSECDEPEGAFRPIHWNHLAGTALLINYPRGMAAEYNAWTGRAHDEICVPEEPCFTECPCVNQTFGRGDFLPVLGSLPFDGNVYDAMYDELMLDFYATGATGLSREGVAVSLDTELTLHPAVWDVRQDGFGPPLTKADMEIFNEYESKFSGTRRCICCWDSTLIGSYARTVAVPNHFLRSKLGTDKGSARIDGKGSTDCDYVELCGIYPSQLRQRFICGRVPPFNCSADLPLLGIATKLIAFNYAGGAENRETAAMNLVGVGVNTDPASIFHDIEYGSCGLRESSRQQTDLGATGGEKSAASGRASSGSGK